MTTRDPTVPETAETAVAPKSELRTQRGVRFSDSEWNLVKGAAAENRISAAEFVRNAALGAIGAPARRDSVTLPPDVLEILKHTYRAAYVVSTLKRNEMLRDGRSEEFEMILEMARMAQVTILNDSPD